METASSPASASLQMIPLKKIFPSPHQMRRVFQEEPLKELAKSLQAEGLLQPIVVRVVGESFELIAGERRLRAAEMIGWETIEAKIIEISDEGAAVKGLIENLQRADLDPIEEARGYRQLVKPPYNLTQEEVSRRVGKSQPAIGRALALLELPEDIQALMHRGVLTESHARVLRKLPEKHKQIQLAKRIDRENLSVKETESLVNECLGWPGRRDAGDVPTPTSQTTLTPPTTPQKDPLAKVWSKFNGKSSGSKKRNWNVRYEGNGQWALNVKADLKNPSETLGDALIHIGRAIRAAK